MIQLKTIVISGQIQILNGEKVFTLKNEIDKQVNPILESLGDDAIDVKYQALNETTALIVIVHKSAPVTASKSKK